MNLNFNTSKLTIHSRKATDKILRSLHCGLQSINLPPYLCSLVHSKSTITTGNGIFAECKLLFRVSKIGHSAKTFFAECRTQQRIALGKEFFAECRALGKKGHSAKNFFAECQDFDKSAALGIGYPA